MAGDQDQDDDDTPRGFRKRSVIVTLRPRSMILATESRSTDTTVAGVIAAPDQEV